MIRIGKLKCKYFVNKLGVYSGQKGSESLPPVPLELPIFASLLFFILCCVSRPHRGSVRGAGVHSAWTPTDQPHLV